MPPPSSLPMSMTRRPPPSRHVYTATCASPPPRVSSKFAWVLSPHSGTLQNRSYGAGSAGPVGRTCCWEGSASTRWVSPATRSSFAGSRYRRVAAIFPSPKVKQRRCVVFLVSAPGVHLSTVSVVHFFHHLAASCAESGMCILCVWWRRIIERKAVRRVDRSWGRAACPPPKCAPCVFPVCGAPTRNLQSFLFARCVVGSAF